MLAGKINKIHKSAANQFLLEDSGWFTVDYEYAKKVIKEVYKNYKKYIPQARKQAKFSRDMFSLSRMDSIFEEILESNLPTIPQQVQLKLPKLKKLGDEKPSGTEPKIKLPKLKKVEA
jgi:hypothetical protein